MNQEFYHKLCITNILKGVEEGLSKYSNPSKVALIFAARPEDPVCVFDPQNILRGHESKLKEIFFDNYPEWQKTIKEKIFGQPQGYMVPENDLALSGLISYGGSSNDFFYQAWLTNHHPDMCSIHPTERWLEQAACLLVHDYNSRTSAINSSDYVLKNYSLQAIADFIVDERDKNLGFDSKILIPPILNDILNISKTREEGAWARGTLFFIDPQRLKEISFITKIQKHERPVISNVKHIRKLLVAVENSDRKLVSDGCTIIGITDSEIPSYAITAEFRGDHGFLKLGNERISSFFDGSFHSTTREAKMVELEELLLDSDLDTEKSTLLFQLISHLVNSAGSGRHGCTLVIDLNETPVHLSGHVLDPSLNLLEPKNIKLTCSFLKIDGAVHITSDLCINGFGCLLDGKTINWENMARGARYNSALRFSADHSRIIVVVVSADRPVSIIYNGIEINAFSHWRPVYQYTPEPVTLKKYLNGVIL
ncbi:MAG: DNA integrity scanning protein DisA nucleotide-binding domain protein [Proteobacteria bacterium]|nr:DNA integrity scanning protein DisA nucleotide-binding domain protein [Pseudomonadota bacterium]MBU1586114.1 DNA integrity scanning protein DisA nucleotide-binding domain protein [Pseudomonadota bacterium]MBU2454768.1 DNA integrity scanning protein DisA nucleotide-binding domain protein [Pseudomonadota bacterium]MBU2627369.1 DNA integrity scanning protein DisA nucleotide-binding domain protein [Pseudomonadota bacterium]